MAGVIPKNWVELNPDFQKEDMLQALTGAHKFTPQITRKLNDLVLQSGQGSNKLAVDAVFNDFLKFVKKEKPMYFFPDTTLKGLPLKKSNG